MVTHIKPGDEVKVKVTIDNLNSPSHTFQIGCTMRHYNTNFDYDLPLEAELNGGSETFNWKVPSNAKKGNYSIITAVWEGKSGSVPYNRLDSETKSRAFSVD